MGVRLAARARPAGGFQSVVDLGGSKVERGVNRCICEDGYIKCPRGIRREMGVSMVWEKVGML